MNKERAILIIAVLGIAIGIYLTIAGYDMSVLACPSVGPINCENVLTSPYSHILGVPASVLAIVLFALAPPLLRKRKDDTMQFLWSTAAIAAMLYSFVGQWLAGSMCLYCLSLDALMIITLSLVYFKK
jgi:uncharacterized membrane protein